jgi:hypothetical protein
MRLAATLALIPVWTIGPTPVALALAASVPVLLAIGEDSAHRDAGRDLAELRLPASAAGS